MILSQQCSCSSVHLFVDVVSQGMGAAHEDRLPELSLCSSGIPPPYQRSVKPSLLLVLMCEFRNFATVVGCIFCEKEIFLDVFPQVERFACLYTSQVTNLSLYSPDKYYRPSEDFMPHEFDILGL